MSGPIAFNLHITSKYARHLIELIQTYRGYAWDNVVPSPTRNAVLRALQAVQGKLLEAIDQASDPLTLTVTIEERLAIQTMAQGFQHWYSAPGLSKEQKASLYTEITWLSGIIERLSPPR